VTLGTREFLRSGFAVLPGLLTDEQLAVARAAADVAVANPSGMACERPNNTLVPLRWDSPLVALVLAGWSRIVEALGARDLRWISGYVSVKEPGSPPLWWHQDWWAWDHPISRAREPAQVALLCYLADTTTATGALRVLPGSHAASGPLHAVLPAAHSDESVALDLRHPAMADQPDQLSLELRAGDAVITDYRLLHGTHPHAGAERRDCVLLSLTPDWGGLPADIRAHLIQHPALPGDREVGPKGEIVARLPSFSGPHRDLALNRSAPVSFATSDRSLEPSPLTS
jgi:Phytanoyl-CoA dioxygenase (PhyH)